MPLHPTQRLQGGRYVLLGLLKAGGEAEVWRALDTSCGEERALKVYDAGDGGAEAAARELSLARRVAHPHVVRTDDAFVEADHAFVVMELAEGSLAERVATMGPLTPQEALAALDGPVRALAAAHAAGVVHRDLKPHNLLVFGDLAGTFGPGGTAVVKLGDFGIAQLRAEGVTRTRSGALLGSLPFMSPEQRRDPKRVGPATDVYAAAVTLAWLVTGEAPGDLYLEATIAELRERLRARGIPEAATDGMCAIVERGGVLAPEARGSLLAWWEGVGRQAELGAGGSRPPQRPPGHSDKVDRRDGMRTTRVWALAVASLLTGAGGAYVATDRGTAPDATTTSTTDTDSLPPCDDIAEDYVTERTNGPREVVAASFDDLDSDGFDDALFVSQLDEQVLVYRGGPHPKLESPIVIPIERAGVPVHAVDVDGDGQRDILALHQDAAKWKAYGLDGKFRVTWTKEWQEQLASATAWVPERTASGTLRILYGSNNNDCLAERTFRGGDLEPARCLTTTMLGRIHAVRVARGVLALTATAGSALQRLDGDTLSSTPVTLPNLYATRQGWASVVTQDRLVELDDAGKTTCRGRLPTANLKDLGDWNHDGVLDSLQAHTCAGCTSNLVVEFGIPR